MKYLLILLMTMASFGYAQKSIHSFSFLSITGEKIFFSQFKGKKIMIVNTASECGFTDQYKELQSVHERYGDNLVVIGFPANDFGKQEPGSDEEIASFCEKNYGVSFIMASKVSVIGDNIDPVFKWLCKQENPSFTGPIKWNFEKFILNESGELIDRFRSITKPDAKKIINVITRG